MLTLNNKKNSILMRKLMMLLFFSFLCGIINPAQAQEVVEEENVPEVVVDKFNNLFPTAKANQWTQHTNIYFVDFVYDNYETQASLEKDGRWLSTVIKMGVEDMPRNVAKNLNEKFPEHEILLSQYTEKSGAEYYYYVQILANEEKIELFFSNVTGEIIRQIGGEDPIDNYDKEKQVVNRKDLPSTVEKYIAEVYPAFRLRESHLLNNKEWKNTYYIILSLDGEPDLVELYFDFKGNLKEKKDPFEERKIMIQNNEAVVNENVEQEKKGNQPENFISEDKIPEEVLEMFNKKIRKAENIMWTKGKNKTYIAHYTNLISGEDAVSSFAENGEWLKTEENVNPKDFRPLITRYLDETYPEYDIHKSVFLSKNDRTKLFYLQIYKREWERLDTLPYHQLWFSYSGRLENKEEVFVLPEDEKIAKQREEEEWEEFQENLEETSFDIENQDQESISRKELPTNITDYIGKNFTSDYRYREIKIKEYKDDLAYYIVMQSDVSKERHEMYFDFMGELIKKKKL
jgi:hypothetical protein